MKLTTYLFLIVLLFVKTGCVGTGKLTTESGKPEILIQGKTSEYIISRLKNWAPTKGQILQSSEGTVVNTLGSVDVPVGWGTTQNIGARTVYNIVPKGSDCKVYSLRFIAASRDAYGYYKFIGSSSVLTNEFNIQEAYDQLQKELEDLAQFIKNN